MAGFSGFLQDLGNLATGGILGAATGRTKELQDQKLKDMEALINDPEKLKAADDYKMGVGAKLANLLTGGIYGQFSGDNQQQQMANMIDRTKLQVRQDQLDQQLYDKLASIAPQPGGTSQWSGK